METEAMNCSEGMALLTLHSSQWASHTLKYFGENCQQYKHEIRNEREDFTCEKVHREKKSIGSWPNPVIFKTHFSP